MTGKKWEIKIIELGVVEFKIIAYIGNWRIESMTYYANKGAAKGAFRNLIERIARHSLCFGDLKKYDELGKILNDS